MKKTVIIGIFMVLCLALVSCGGTYTADSVTSGGSEGGKKVSATSSLETEQTESVEETAPMGVAEEPKTTVTTSESCIRPEFKEAMDSYEAFFDEYVLFMERYLQNPGDLSLLNAYANYMLQYTDMMKKLDAMDETDLTAAELSYYIEVTARIEQKLLSVAY